GHGGIGTGGRALGEVRRRLPSRAASQRRGLSGEGARMNNVVLVGFMGSGKTTVGRELADRTGRPFIDLDDEIAADAGRSIADIFADEGEAGFRERESRGLEHALRQDDAIIAAGGGTPSRGENWRGLRRGTSL